MLFHNSHFIYENGFLVVDSDDMEENLLTFPNNIRPNILTLQIKRIPNFVFLFALQRSMPFEMISELDASGNRPENFNILSHFYYFHLSEDAPIHLNDLLDLHDGPHLLKRQNQFVNPYMLVDRLQASLSEIVPPIGLFDHDIQVKSLCGGNRAPRGGNL